MLNSKLKILITYFNDKNNIWSMVFKNGNIEEHVSEKVKVQPISPYHCTHTLEKKHLK